MDNVRRLDDELERALALSLQQPSGSAPSTANEEERAIAAAIALSLGQVLSYGMGRGMVVVDLPLTRPEIELV
jgi:hypothetical protein